VPLLRKKRGYFDVAVQDLVLRIHGPRELYEEARAAGLHFWEQIQSYALRDPAFRSSTRPLPVPEDAPLIIQEMIGLSARAGVGPMFSFQGAVTEWVGRAMAREFDEVMVSCGGDYFVVTGKRSRLMVHPAVREGESDLAVVVKPELGPHGIFTTMGRAYLPADTSDGVVVLAGSCILADAAAAAAMAILSKPGWFHAALSYLQRLEGVHGALVIRGERIGVAGALELAA
jgi:ApbE superfamily uncharacterized protein (UPF0280 family)